jgi:cytochrome c5
MKKFRLAIIIAVGGFLAFGVTQGASSQDYDGESLVKTRCSQCHNLGRVEAAKKVKDRAAWEQTVDRMISKRDNLLNDAERRAVLDFLVQK